MNNLNRGGSRGVPISDSPLYVWVAMVKTCVVIGCEPFFLFLHISRGGDNSGEKKKSKNMDIKNTEGRLGTNHSSQPGLL